MKSLWKLNDFLAAKMKIFGAACLVGMVLLTCVDIIGRQFKYPVFGSIELVAFMGVLAVAMALPFTHENKGHIGVELFVIKLPARLRAMIDICTGLLSLFLFLIVTWRMFEYSLKMKASGEVSMNLQLPEYLIIFLVALSCAVFCLTIIRGIVENFAKWVRK